MLLFESIDQFLLLETFEALGVATMDQGLHLESQAADSVFTISDHHVDVLGKVLFALSDVKAEGLLTERNLLAIVILHVAVARRFLVLRFVVNCQLGVDQVRDDDLTIIILSASAS